MLIDEIQLVPELLRPIKVAVDLDPTPSRFLLTGSSRILGLRTLPDAPPGRMEVIELWPFSQGEISGEPDRFVNATISARPGIEHSSTLRRRDYLDRVVVGGFLKAVRRPPRRRTAFFDSYLSTLIERDVLELVSIERRGDLLKLLALLAGRGCWLTHPGRTRQPVRHSTNHPDALSGALVVRTFSSRAFLRGRLDRRNEP